MANNQNQNQSNRNRNQRKGGGPRCSCGKGLPPVIAGEPQRPRCYDCWPNDFEYGFSTDLTKGKGKWQIFVQTYEEDVFSGENQEDVAFMWQVDGRNLKMVSPGKPPFKKGNIGSAIISIPFSKKEQKFTMYLLGSKAQSNYEIVIPATKPPSTFSKVEPKGDKNFVENFIAAVKGKW